MLSDITAGNAKTDGREFRFWFVGEIETWCRDNAIPFDRKRFGLRNTSEIEVKWGMYKKADSKTSWGSCSDMIAMSVLVRGDFTFYFREAGDRTKTREVRLRQEGDYVIWREDIEHTWKMYEDSEILTLRWPVKIDP